MRKLEIRVTVAAAMLVAGCGGDTAAVTSTTSPTTTTQVPNTTTTEPPTTTTTEALPAPPTVDELAAMIVLESGFFGPDWDEVPQTESDFSYAVVEGCAFVDTLNDADGNLAEAKSPQFSQADTGIEHDVRVYATTEDAIDVVVAWAQDPALECTLEGARTQAQESLDRGELAPFTGVDFDITRYDDLVGEPRVTNFEVMTTLSSSEQEAVIFVDIYFVQYGRFVSRVEVTSPDTLWSQTDQLLDAVLDRMHAADTADAG